MSPFDYYNAAFDARGVMKKFAAATRTPRADFLTNYLGVVIREDYLPEILRGKSGTLEDLPTPANWHADISEWAAVLRAIDLAPGPRFVMGELGCGWGCWMVNSGVASRSKGLAPSLYGVEADEGHCEFAKDCMTINGLAPEEYKIVRGVAAATSGTALFPRQSKSGVSWGLEPVFGASRSEVERARREGSHDIVDMVPLQDLFGSEKRVDLLHVDIQGGELDLVKSSVSFLDSFVAYLVIGTHSRSIEGAIIDQMMAAGWLLEIERPAIFNLPLNGITSTTVDGVQGWRNPRLLPLQVKEIKQQDQRTFSKRLKRFVNRLIRRRS